MNDPNEETAQTAPMPPHVAEDSAKLRELLPVPEPPMVPPDPPQNLDKPREHGSVEPQPEGNST